MSIFQCERCGCAENTASGCGLFYHSASSFDWSYAPDRKGMKLCSACGPLTLAGGQHPTITGGKWHGLFDRVFLPMGMFKTDLQGNLAHIETGETNIRKYEIKRAKFPVTRPLPGRHVHGWTETDAFLGLLHSIQHRSGVALLQGSILYDSNHVIYWSYADEQDQ